MIASAALLLGSTGTTPAAADVAQVSVVSPGGAAGTLSLNALAPDVVERSYTVRSALGESQRQVSGFSLAALLEAAGADPFGFSYLEVRRPGGGSVLLDRDQALDDSAFAEGPPVVYATTSGTGFLRPSAGAEDQNEADCFEASQGISIVLLKGSPLQVRAHASTPWTRPGKPVRFSAVIDRAGAGSSLSFSWYFDDGHSASGPEVSHSFAEPGSYDVVVGVTTGGGDPGSSAVVGVQVGPPPDGPDRKGGGQVHDDAAPDHGASAGPPGGAARGSHGEEGRSAPAPAPTPAPPPSAGAPSGERVAGELLGPPADVVPASARQAAARRGRLQSDGGGDPVPGAVWGLLSTLALIGAGALIESGALAHLRPRGRPA